MNLKTNNPEPKKSNVELEDLFALKRLEKPAPEFWESFDQQLHQRALQALSTKKTFSFKSTILHCVHVLRNPFLRITAAAALVICAVVSRVPSLPTAAPAFAVAFEQGSTQFVHTGLSSNASSTAYADQRYSNVPALNSPFASATSNASGGSVVTQSAQMVSQLL